MRAVFGVLSLLMVLAIVGVLAKKQLGSATVPVVPAMPGAEVPAAGAPPATPKEQVQQFKQAIDAALVPPRAMPDDPK